MFTTENLKEISESYIVECENLHAFDWRYYYIKYPTFRLGRFGKYRWENYAERPCEMLALWTEYSWSSNSRQPFLYEIDKNNIDRDDNGRRLSYVHKILVCENAAFIIKARETDEEHGRIEIAQNEHGIDTEDRIIRERKQLNNAIGHL